jgi:hypothetical protein
VRIPAIESIKEMGKKEYWNKANIVEFIAFTTKLVIIFPGLLFGVQFWWLYIFALASSILLVWSSTVKTLPTVILFNFGWIILATVAITKYFLS